MARFYGVVGYSEGTVETTPGVWEESIIERQISGDLLRNDRRLESGESVNDNLRLNNKFSIVADAYSMQHFFAMRYLMWMGARWKVTNVEVQSPRLILTIGEVYNGPTA